MTLPSADPASELSPNSVTADQPRVGADPASLTQWLCEIPSPIGEERALADALWARAQAYWSVAGAPIRLNDSMVLPLATAEAGRPRLLLVGHLDTVRTQHDGPPRIEGDRLFGCGAADMKSGLALMIGVAENPALRAALAGRLNLSLVFYAREEGPYAENELGPLLDAVPSLSQQDLAICLEPSSNRLQLGCVGSLHAQARFVGRTAHSARPWQGENAIHRAWTLLRDLSALEPESIELDGLTYRGVISATLAHGGRGRNVVPDEFVLNLNHRFIPGRTVAEAEQYIRALVGDRAEVTITDRSPSALPHREHPLVHRLVATGANIVEPKQAWTDVARFAERGVAAVNWGPGDQAQAHQRNESTSVAALNAGAGVLETFLRDIAR